jgi:acetyl esterase/lipase
MADAQTLDPHVQLMLAVQRRTGLGIGSGSPAERRRESRRSAALAMPRALGVAVSDCVLPVEPQPLPARRYRAERLDGRPLPTIMYLHGGGWTIGDLDTHDGVCRLVALSSGCNVVSVGYRLAPEHPHPAGPDDTLAAFRWIRENPLRDELPGAVAVMGDSAGANLAAVVSQDCVRAGQPGPVAAGLVYPGTDIRMRHRSIDLFAEGYFLTREEMAWFRSQYVPDASLWADPRVSPLLGDLAGQPPTWVWTAGFDPLRDEGQEYAQRLRLAGVAVSAHCYPGQVHGFLNMGVLPGAPERVLQIGRQFGDLIRAALS